MATRNRRSALRRVAATLAGVALLNVLIAPVALACEPEGGDALAMTTATPSAHDMRGPHDDSHSPQSGPATNTPAECRDGGTACSNDCVVMPGCQSVSFVVAEQSPATVGAADSIASPPIATRLDRWTVPDHPPPRT